MRFILCFVLPPVGVLACGGSVGSFLLNVFLTCCLWVPGILHALYIRSRFVGDSDLHRQALRNMQAQEDLIKARAAKVRAEEKRIKRRP